MLLLTSSPRDASRDSGSELTSRWLLVAHCSLKPFEASFVELSVRGEPTSAPVVRKHSEDASRLEQVGGVVPLMLGGSAHTQWQVARQVDRTLICEASLFEVVLHEGIEGNFATDGVDVQMLPGGALHVVWDPRPRRPANKSRKLNRGQWAVFAAGSSDEEPVDTGLLADRSSADEGEGVEDYQFGVGGASPIGAPSSSTSSSAESANEESDIAELGDFSDGQAAPEADPLGPLPPPPPPPPPPAPIADALGGREKRIVVQVPPFGELVWYSSSPARKSSMRNAWTPTTSSAPATRTSISQTISSQSRAGRFAAPRGAERLAKAAHWGF